MLKDQLILPLQWLCQGVFLIKFSLDNGHRFVVVARDKTEQASYKRTKNTKVSGNHVFSYFKTIHGMRNTAKIQSFILAQCP